MEPRRVAESVVVALIAAAYAAGALYLAGTGTGDLLLPLSAATFAGVPLAVGLIASCAPAGVLVAVGGGLAAVAVGAAVAVTAGWLPLAWLGFEWWALIPGALVGALAGRAVGNRMARATAALVVALLPAVVGRWLPHPAAATDPVVADSHIAVAAPAIDLWEEVIGSDSLPPGTSPRDSATAPNATGRGVPAVTSIALERPRPLAVRRVTFADGSADQERISEWDDAEHLQVVSAPRVVPPLRGTAAWRAGWGASNVLSSGASYDLVASGDSASALNVRGTYHVAVHANAYPAAWVEAVARGIQDTLVATIRRRAEARASAAAPRLTADMRMLRAAVLDDLRESYGRTGEALDHDVLFVNGDRAAELPETLPPNEPLDAARAGPTLRAALRPAADRARTTVWMQTGLGALADAASMAAGDTLRLEFEDYEGHCVAESTPVAFAPGGQSFVVGVPRRARCEQSVMAERTRRSRLIANLPITAGKLEDSWSVALAATGTVRVYLDSVVVRADTLRLKAKPLDGAAQAVDSVTVGLSLGGERSWSVVKRAPAIHLDRTLAAQQEWMQRRLRFAIPIDASFPFEQSWPTFEVILTLPKTKDNPYGIAWTYAHAPMAFFKGVQR